MYYDYREQPMKKTISKCMMLMTLNYRSPITIDKTQVTIEIDEKQATGEIETTQATIKTNTLYSLEKTEYAPMVTNLEEINDFKTITIRYTNLNDKTDKEFQCHETDSILFVEHDDKIIPFTVKVVQSRKKIHLIVQQKEGGDDDIDEKLYELLTPIMNTIKEARTKHRLGFDEHINRDANDQADQVGQEANGQQIAQIINAIIATAEAQ